MKRAAFFDVDGTLTTTRVWQGVMEYFRQHHLRPWTHRVFWLVHTPLYLLHRGGLVSEGAFRAPWAAHLAWYVRGYSLQDAQAIWNWVVTEYMPKRWREDTVALLREHQRNHDLVVLVSGGPQPLLERIAQEWGVQHYIGTRFEVKDGRYNGRSLKPVCIDENKRQLTEEYLQQKGLQIDLRESYAYADAISDLPLLEMVGHPVATYPDVALKAIAEARGWRVFPPS